jgi:aldehyde dehydrogenase (NAD+)
MTVELREAQRRVTDVFGLAEVNSSSHGGDRLPTIGRATLECRSPVDGGLLGQVTLAGSDDYEQVVAASVAAYHEWKRLPAPKRGEIVADVGAELAANKVDLGPLVSLEVGKSITEGQGESRGGHLP